MFGQMQANAIINILQRQMRLEDRSVSTAVHVGGDMTTVGGDHVGGDKVGGDKSTWNWQMTYLNVAVAVIALSMLFQRDGGNGGQTVIGKFASIFFSK